MKSDKNVIAISSVEHNAAYYLEGQLCYFYWTALISTYMLCCTGFIKTDKLCLSRDLSSRYYNILIEQGRDVTKSVYKTRHTK